MDENAIRWKVTDPLGNEIILKKATFRHHICGDHDDKDAAIRVAIEDEVQYTLMHPRFILKDRKFINRRRYFNMAVIPFGEDQKLKGVGIIVEVETTPFRVVTWYTRRVIDEPYKDEELIYDARVQRSFTIIDYTKHKHELKKFYPNDFAELPDEP